MRLRSIIHFIETRPLFNIKSEYSIHGEQKIDSISGLRNNFLSTLNQLSDLPMMGFINRRT